jgi:hypothetical protein
MFLDSPPTVIGFLVMFVVVTFTLTAAATWLMYTYFCLKNCNSCKPEIKPAKKRVPQDDLGLFEKKKS